MKTLATRNLSLKGRVLISNMLLASKIWYTSYIFPPTASQRDRIQHTINIWAKKNSRILPSPLNFQLPIAQGGWNLVNIKASIMARQTMMASKLMFSNENWAKYKRAEIRRHQENLSSIEDIYLGTQWPKHIRSLIKTWHLAGRPDYRETTTKELVSYFKKDFTNCKVWPAKDFS